MELLFKTTRGKIICQDFKKILYVIKYRYQKKREVLIMKKKLYIFITLLGIFSLFSIYFYKKTQIDIFQVLAITFCTTFYHFAVRFIFAAFLDVTRNKNMLQFYNYKKKWFREKPFEKKLYKFLKVKNWKTKVPTWNPESFSLKKHSKSEVVLSTCQAEFIHEVNCLLSLLPIFASIFFGAFLVFFLTSLAGCLLDLGFVIIQRFNRPRILKFDEKAFLN